MANDPKRTDKIALNDVGGHFESGDEYGMRVVKRPRHQFYCSQCRQFWVRSFGQWEYLGITDGDAISEICPECHKTNVELASYKGIETYNNILAAKVRCIEEEYIEEAQRRQQG